MTFSELKSSHETRITGFYFLGLGWITLNRNAHWRAGELDKLYNFDSYKNIFIW